MAEQNIMSVADDFSVTLFKIRNWVCRDDNDDYWTVIRDVDGNLKVYKSIDSGITWSLKKTLTNADWTNGTPLPTDVFEIVNLSGLDKIYVYINEGINKKYSYGWIFNVTADTNQKDLDKVEIVNTQDTDTPHHIAYDLINHRLLIICQNLVTTYIRFGKINLNGTITNGDVLNTSQDEQPMDYYICPITGYGYVMLWHNNAHRIWQMNNGETNYNTARGQFAHNWIYGEPRFGNIFTDSDGNPCYAFDAAGDLSLRLHKRNKDNLSTILLDTYTGISVLNDIAFATIDGNNNIYYFFTKSTDKEAYYKKYDSIAATWGSEVKISSDNDGQLVSPEIRPKINENKIILTYQSLS